MFFPVFTTKGDPFFRHTFIQGSSICMQSKLSQFESSPVRTFEIADTLKTCEYSRSQAENAIKYIIRLALIFSAGSEAFSFRLIILCGQTIIMSTQNI